MQKRSWKFWLGTSLLTLVLLGAVFIINLIYFKPFSIRLFYDRVMIEAVMESPEIVSSMSIPVLYDWFKYDLSDASDEYRRKVLERTRDNYEMLLSYDYDSQSPENQLNTRIFRSFLESQLGREPFFYHGYPVNQMFGVQNGLPSFMEQAHKLRNESDVEAYLSRLKKFRVKFEQILEGLNIREDKGIIPPRFVIGRVLDEMRGFVSSVESNILYTNFVTKVESIEDLTEAQKESYKSQVREAIANDVFGAYQLFIDYFEGLEDIAGTDDGAWKHPDGDAYYRYMLRQYTTTELDPEEVHQIGLAEVERIKAEMWEVLLAQGHQDNGMSIGEMIQSISNDERFFYPTDDPDKSRDQILADYEEILAEVSAGLDDAFDVRPKAGLEVKRVPAFREVGAAGAYYTRPAIDGSRGGVFYANLRDVRETLKPDMKTLAYHEGIPGHHFQIAIQAELEGMPIFRTIGFATAFIEGWALYAERLAWELGFYEDDPFGNLGRLKAEMFRAVRLVVDTGIHHKRWTREEAIDYMVANTGMSGSEVVTEIERYIVMPGQACAYKIGMMKILDLRERARAELGEKFDLRKFHNVVLKNGAVPLDILEEIIEDYIAAESA